MPHRGPRRTEKEDRTQECGRTATTSSRGARDERLGPPRSDRSTGRTQAPALMTRPPTPTTSGTPGSGPSTVSIGASLRTTDGRPTTGEARPTPEREPRRRNSGTPASSATPSTEAACGAVSEHPSRRSRSTKRAAETATRPLETPYTTGCDAARPAGRSISATTGHVSTVVEN